MVPKLLEAETDAAAPMLRLQESDRDWLMRLLKQEPEFNLFLIGDVENYGFSEPFQEIWAHFLSDKESEKAIDSIVLRYYTNFVVYSEHENFDITPIIAILKDRQVGMISGKKQVIDRLKPYLPGFSFSDTYMMKRPTLDSLSGNVEQSLAAVEPQSRRQESLNKPQIELAKLKDVADLAAFVYGIDEFAVPNQTLAERTQTLKRSLSSAGTRYVIIREQGRIVACAGTTAENSQSAMVISVATDPTFRRRGYATRLVSRLCSIHAEEGREFLCLFYSNPAAGVIYRGLGFREIGIWVMVRPPKAN
ncbi:MAG: GNAT family N-acetyltransferase [Ruminococcaceae bacterium]|nr:GNAT family N-acetyltransferase [Oscillospiraceae bacterium]